MNRDEFAHKIYLLLSGYEKARYSQTNRMLLQIPSGFSIEDHIPGQRNGLHKGQIAATLRHLQGAPNCCKNIMYSHGKTQWQCGKCKRTVVKERVLSKRQRNAIDGRFVKTK